MANKALRLPVSELRKEGATNSALFCLPMGGRDVLLSLSDRLLWDIYQENDGTRVILSDDEKAIIESTIEGLLMACEIDMTPIGDGLQAIADALENLQSTTVNCSPDVTVNCGAGDNFIIIPGPGEDPIINPGPLPTDPLDPDNPFPLPDDWPDEPLDPETDPPPYGETWEEYDADACAAANAIWNSSYQACRVLQEQFTETAVTLAALVIAINAIAVGGLALLFSREFIIALARSAWRLISAVGLEVIEEFFGEIADLMLANKQEMICFLYRARIGGNDAMNEYIAMSWNFAIGTNLYAAEPTMAEGVLRLLFSGNAFRLLLAAGQSYAVPDPLSCDTCDELPQHSWHGLANGDYDLWVNDGGAELTRDGLVWTHTAVGEIGYYEAEVTVDVATFLARVQAERIVAARMKWLDITNDGTNARIRNWPILNAATILTDSQPVGEYRVRYDSDMSNAAVEFVDAEGYIYITSINLQPDSDFRFRPETYTAGSRFSFTIEYLVERD